LIPVDRERTDMPDITVSPDQRERLRWIQRRLADDVEYGHVRPSDALEYLLDHAEATDGLGEEISANDGADGRVDEVDDRADEVDDGPADDSISPGATEETMNGGAVTRTAAPEMRVVNGVTDGTAGSDDDGGDDDSDSDDQSTPTKPAGPPSLNSMLSLLETHEDKWREADGGEEKYEVDLPDGSTTGARTKDDVKAVLFKQYR
jgi:hypothetical protein